MALVIVKSTRIKKSTLAARTSIVDLQLALQCQWEVSRTDITRDIRALMRGRSKRQLLITSDGHRISTASILISSTSADPKSVPTQGDTDQPHAVHQSHWPRHEHPPHIHRQIYLLALFFPFALTFLFLPVIPNLSFAFSLASTLLFSSLAWICAGVNGMSSSRTPIPPTEAPRSLIRPSLRCSVMMGEAAGRYLNSSE